MSNKAYIFYLACMMAACYAIFYGIFVMFYGAQAVNFGALTTIWLLFVVSHIYITTDPEAEPVITWLIRKAITSLFRAITKALNKA